MLGMAMRGLLLPYISSISDPSNPSTVDFLRNSWQMILLLHRQWHMYCMRVCLSTYDLDDLDSMKAMRVISYI